MEAIHKTGAEYEVAYQPFGEFLFVAKDLAPEKQGMIHVPHTVRQDHSKYTSTGVVISKSKFTTHESETEGYWFSKIEPGDRIGFGTTVPLYSPSPPHWTFEGDDKERYITLHVKDVICVICETEEQRAAFAKRFTKETPNG